MVTVGEIYADLHSPGREVQVIEVLDVGFIVETVTPADTASSERAVGRQTMVAKKTFDTKFRLTHPPL